MTYNWKAAQEIAWAAFVAFVVFAGTAFLTNESVTDWRAWGIATLAGSARAAVAVVIAALSRGRVTAR